MILHQRTHYEGYYRNTKWIQIFWVWQLNKPDQNHREHKPPAAFHSSTASVCSSLTWTFAAFTEKEACQVIRPKEERAVLGNPPPRKAQSWHRPTCALLNGLRTSTSAFMVPQSQTVPFNFKLFPFQSSGMHFRDKEKHCIIFFSFSYFIKGQRNNVMRKRIGKVNGLKRSIIESFRGYFIPIHYTTVYSCQGIIT